MMKYSNFPVNNVLMKYILLVVICFSWASQSKAQEKLTQEKLFGSLQARSIGPAVMSGRVSTLAVVEKDPSIVYIGAAGGGIWKSNRAGASFIPVFDEYIQSIGKITIDQQRPDTVWVGTGEVWVRNTVSVGDGIYKTTDGGATWKNMGLPQSERIADIIIHPDKPNTVYVAAMGQLWSANDERGVFKTTDGGESWQKVLYTDENTGAADLAIDPENPEILYATMWSHRRYPWSFNSGMVNIDGYKGKSAVYKSINGGKDWYEIHKGLPNETKGRMAIAVANTNASRLYLTVEVQTEELNGLYISNDKGESWQLINKDFNTKVRPFYFANIIISPHDEDVVYKCGLNLIISNNGGNSFRTVGSGVHSDVHDAWIDPNNKNHVFIGTDGGVYESFDGGYLYKMWMNLPLSQFYRVSVDNETPYNIYGGLQDNGSWYGPSAKAGGIGNDDWEMSYGGDGFYSFRHPTDEDIIYSEFQGGNLIRYNKKTGNAQSIKPTAIESEEKFRYNWNTPIHISPNNPERLYIGAQYLFVTENRGLKWQHISPDLTTNDKTKQMQHLSGGLTIDNSTAENHCTIYAIAESPKDENVVWVGTDDGNLQVTNDFGKTWNNVITNVPGLPENTWVSFIEASPHDASSALVTFDGHRTGDKTTYVYMTTDQGKTWKNLTSEDIEGYALSVRQDLKNPELLFLGTEFGLFISIDQGTSWAQFDNGIPKVAVRDMVIHPTEHSLVIGTHGRGVFILDDLLPLRQMGPDILQQDLVFFQMKPTYLKDPGAGGNWYSGAGNFIAGNPSSNAQIAYYMKKRHTFGKMYIEVYDPEGILLRELPAGKSAGVNIVTMPSGLPPPKSAPTNNRMALLGGLSGPNLLPGKYKVKLIKGKNEYNTSFELKYEENSPYSLQDRDIQRDNTMQLYQMSEDLAYIYYCLETIESKVAGIAKDEKKFAKKLNSWKEEINKFKGSLVGLGGDGYVNEEEKIREEISESYRLISNYPGKPTDTQIAQVNLLQSKMDNVQQQYENIAMQLDTWNKKFTKLGIDTIKPDSKESFLQ